jgi:Protein of unknown function (DUF2846)
MTMGKALAFGLLVVSFATPSLAQNAPAHKATTTIQCRPLNGSSTPIQSDEQLIGEQICKAVPVAVAQTESTATSPAVTTSHADTTKPDTATATDKPSPSEEQAPATIYFYRPRRFQGSALKPSVFVDDARSGQLHNGDSIKVSVPPGNHRIYSTDKSTGVELNAKSGQTYYVRVDIQVGFWKGHGGVTLVDPQEGKYETAQAAHQGADKE